MLISLPFRFVEKVNLVNVTQEVTSASLAMGGFGGGGGRWGRDPPFFLNFFRNVWKVTVFRVVLRNNPKDVHVLWVLSEVALSPPPPLILKFLDPPLLAQGLEHWSCKPGVDIANISRC